MISAFSVSQMVCAVPVRAEALEYEGSTQIPAVNWYLNVDTSAVELQDAGKQ